MACEAAWPCCSFGNDVPFADCTRLASDEWDGETSRRMPSEGPRAAFDPAMAARALDKARALFSTCPPLMGSALAHSVKEDAQWAIGRRPLPIGAPCTFRECGPVAFCGARQTCETALAVGQPCPAGSAQFCPSGTWCSSSTFTCQPRSPVGAPCDRQTPSGLQCVDGAYCDESQGPALCRPMLGPGAYCHGKHSCFSGHCQSASPSTAPQCLSPITGEFCTRMRKALTRR